MLWIWIMIPVVFRNRMCVHLFVWWWCHEERITIYTTLMCACYVVVLLEGPCASIRDHHHELLSLVDPSILHTVCSWGNNVHVHCIHCKLKMGKSALRINILKIGIQMLSPTNFYVKITNLSSKLKLKFISIGKWPILAHFDHAQNARIKVYGKSTPQIQMKPQKIQKMKGVPDHPLSL